MMLPIFENAKTYNNSIAIIDNTGSYSYSTLLNQSKKIAQAILQYNIHNQPILFLFPSSYNYVSVQWGIWLSGCTAVPVHISHTKNEIDYLIQDTNTSLFIYDKNFEEKINLLEKTSVQCITLDDLLLNKNDNLKTLPTTTLVDNALMIYTSGTTGKPKGVVISH